jgi:hypothetical protein
VVGTSGIDAKNEVNSARRWFAAGAVGLSVASILILASRQVHPDSTEFVASSLVLLIGLVVAIALLEREDLRRIAPFALAGLLTLAVVGWLKPTNLVVVALVLGHPLVFIIVAAFVADRSYLPLPTSRLNELCRTVLGIVVAVTLLYGAVTVLFETHRTYGRSVAAEAGPAWIDTTEGGFDGGCTDSHGYLRTGTGLSLREEYLGDACEGSPTFDSYHLTDDPPGKAHGRSDAIVCTPAATHRGMIVIEFDPVTLAGAEQADSLCA